MIKTNSHINGVSGMIFLAQTINPEIGYYQEHFINEHFNFTAKLSNGTIDMTIEDAQDYETRPGSITFKRIEKVAGTFKKNN
jgi:L-cystine uptake protein TcyP (sodium:dicarboxylate symporter family)